MTDSKKQPEQQSNQQPNKQAEPEELEARKPFLPTNPLFAKPNKSNQQKIKGIPTKWIWMLFFVVFMVIGLLLAIVYQTLFGRLEQSAKIVEVNAGQSYYAMVTDLKEEIPLFSETVAKLYIKSQIERPLHIGTYEMPKNPNLIQTIKVLKKGAESAVIRIQIIEGKTAKDLYRTIKNTKGINIEVLNDFEESPETVKSALNLPAYTPKGKLNYNLEGWFAPDTYIYSEGTTDRQILTDLYQRQQHILDKAWQSRDSDLPYKSPYEALIMASIIEKETGLANERAEVAGVFVNRLRKRMKLQTDPTIIYGMGDRYKGDIRKKDIREKTAYNTYQIKGLPPTPIALPSTASIDAALHPADTDALYFVATGKGGHKFSKTLKEHNKAVQEYLQVMKAKEQ